MEHFTPVFVAIDGWDSAVLPWILRDWLYRLPRRRTYAFGFQNCLNKLGFRIAVGITITLVLVGQIRFQSRINRRAFTSRRNTSLNTINARKLG